MGTNNMFGTGEEYMLYSMRKAVQGSNRKRQH